MGPNGNNDRAELRHHSPDPPTSERCSQDLEMARRLLTCSCLWLVPMVSHVRGSKMDKTQSAPLRLLLVDDDIFVHEMVASLIDEAEYSLVSATNVGDAMKLIREQQPDIIVTDAMMPGESGFGLINRVKSDPRTQDIPVILLTILQDPSGEVMDASGQADFRVSKPLYLSDFNSTLEQARQLRNDRSEAKIHSPELEDTVTIVF